MKKVFYTLSILILFTGCRTARETSYMEARKTNVTENTVISSENQLSQAVTDALQKVIHENMSVTFKQTVYDTEQPAHTDGKHPVISETDIILHKDTRSVESSENKNYIAQTAAVKLESDTEINTDMSVNNTTVKKTPSPLLSHLYVAFIFLGVIGLVYLYVRKKIL